jgi:8-amino-7-oxononanoate synthase
MAQWDALVDAALARLAARSLLRATRPIALAAPPAAPRTFPGPGPWDRAAVEIRLDCATLQEWLAEGQCRASVLSLAAGNYRNCGLFWALLDSSVLGMEQPVNPAQFCSAHWVRFIFLGGEASVEKEEADGNLILFSGNDYIGLSSHPAIREAAVKVS